MWALSIGAPALGTVWAWHDLYEVLQVHRRAEPDVIRAAYRALARKYHPDFGGDAVPGWSRINEAWWRARRRRRAGRPMTPQLAKAHDRRATDRAVPGAGRREQSPSARGSPAQPTGPRHGHRLRPVRRLDASVASSTTIRTTSSGSPARRSAAALRTEIEAVLAQRAGDVEPLRPTGTTGRRGRH